jgi:hypothetical protein
MIRTTANTLRTNLREIASDDILSIWRNN